MRHGLSVWNATLEPSGDHAEKPEGPGSIRMVEPSAAMTDDPNHISEPSGGPCKA